MNEKVKICTKCKIEFPATIEYFCKNPRGKYGIKSWCRKCENKINRIKNNKSVKDLTDNYIKHHLKKRNIEITPEIIEIQRLQILIKRHVSVTFDNIEFKSIEKLSEYLSKKTNIPFQTIDKRLRRGCSIEDSISKYFKSPSTKRLYYLKCLDLNKEYIDLTIKEIMEITKVCRGTIMSCIKNNELLSPSYLRRSLKYTYKIKML